MLDHPSAIKPHGRPIPFTGGSAILVTILAIGQDIVCSPRLGCHDQGMPDDNLVVCDYMNPQFHGGSVTAPFQFALYAQGSLVPALAGALGLGFLLGLAWPPPFGAPSFLCAVAVHTFSGPLRRRDAIRRSLPA